MVAGLANTKDVTEMENAESRAGDWLGSSLDKTVPDQTVPDRSPGAEDEWRVSAGEVSFVEASPGDRSSHAGAEEFGDAHAGAGTPLPPSASGSALALLNDRIDRIEGLIAGELSVRLQNALAQMPTRESLTQAVNEAVETSTTEVVSQAVQPLVEAVSQLQAQHEAEVRRREEKHQSDVEKLVQQFNALGDEMARHNALTEEQISRLQEKKTRWRWPWNEAS